MAYTQNRIIHRFIRDIREYDEGGICYGQILPLDTQVFANYSPESGHTDEDGNPKIGLFFVIGDGVHTYNEICNGQGLESYNKEYRSPLASSTELNNVHIKDLQDHQFLNYNQDTDAWENIYGPLIPIERLLELDTLDCGNAFNEAEIILDGGNSNCTFTDIADAGRGAAGNYTVEFVNWIN